MRTVRGATRHIGQTITATRCKEGTMTTRTMLWGVGCGGIRGALLWAGPAGAQPFPGGLPACQAALTTCQADLAACQAASSEVRRVLHGYASHDVHYID